MKTLIIVSHPDLENSIANKAILNYLQEQVENMVVRHLESLYPDFKIDVKAEQKALIEADIIVFQHPFYWYSTPAMLKQWMDQVLVWGFAFGTHGDKLKGKHFMQSLTVGGAKESYTPLGYNHFSIGEFLRPMEQTVYLTQMHYHGFIHTHRNFYAEGVWNAKNEVRETAKGHAEQVAKFVEKLRKGNAEKVKHFVYKWFKHFDVLDENGFFIQYLSQEVKMKFPDADEFSGHEGFHHWYNATKEAFVGNTEHQVEDLRIEEVEKNTFKIDMGVQLKATTKEQRLLELTVNEAWELVWDEVSDRPIINEYLVTIK